MDKINKFLKNNLNFNRLIISAILFSVVFVFLASLIFYTDSRSKYDLVRPGRRVLPKTFNIEEGGVYDAGQVSQESSLLDIEVDALKKQLQSIDSYGIFEDNLLDENNFLIRNNEINN
jgi:hypothetical protein